MPARRPAEGPEARFGARPVPYQIGTRVWSAGRLLLLAALLVVTFGAFFLTALRVTTRAREVSVPDVLGRDIKEATAVLAQAGLALTVDQRRADPKIAADHVLSQDPAPGTVLRRQRTVRVRVSDGQRDPEIPSVVGLAERTAEIVLTQASVAIGARSEVHTGSYPAGTIIAQDPPGSGRAGSVSLLVNRGQAGTTYVMPDVIGTLGVRVVDILRRRGFRVTIGADVPYPGLPPGVVVRQTPQAGFQVALGEPIVLELSR
jgi:beta-lactam-binding protein with PASTA domain